MVLNRWPVRWYAVVLLVVVPLAAGVIASTGSGARPVSRPPIRVDAAADAELDLLLERAAAYVADFVSNFSAAIAEEQYVQTVFRDPGSEDRSLGSTTRRVLRSDFVLVRRPDTDQIVPFRDVFEVDGKPVRDRQERLQKLFLQAPATAMADAARIADEGVRYNIGPVDRTVNVPTLPLQFLEARYRSRFEFKKGRQEAVEGLRVWRIDYTEKGRPTLIRRKGGDNAPAEGAFWIDGASGTVVRTRVRVVLPRDPATAPSGKVFGLAQEETVGRASLDAEIAVTYRRSDALGLWLPAEMKETYQYGERHIRATATYSSFREFEIKSGA